MTDTTDIKALRDSAECMANLLDNLAGYEPSDIDMDTVEIRFEDGNGFDTGCDISIVDTAQKSADIIRSLIDQLEAERQQREAAEAVAVALAMRDDMRVAREELAALRGTQEPDEATVYMMPNVFASLVNTARDVALEYKNAQCLRDALSRELKGYFTLTRQPKPVVVLPKEFFTAKQNMRGMFELSDDCMCGITASMESAGIVVKDGE